MESSEFQYKGAVTVFVLKNMISFRIARELAERGAIGDRAGCHCAHILVKQILGISPGLEKFQRIILNIFPKLELPGVTRVSLGIHNDEQQVKRFIQVLGEIEQHSKSSRHQQDSKTSDYRNAWKKVTLEIEEFIKFSRKLYFLLIVKRNVCCCFKHYIKN